MPRRPAGYRRDAREGFVPVLGWRPGRRLSRRRPRIGPAGRIINHRRQAPSGTIQGVVVCAHLQGCKPWTPSGAGPATAGGAEERPTSRARPLSGGVCAAAPRFLSRPTDG